VDVTQNRRNGSVGIYRFLRVAWLERTAYLVLAGNRPQGIRKVLSTELGECFAPRSSNRRNSLEKTIAILMHIWVTTPRHLVGLQGDGLELLSACPSQDHLAFHWGMTMAVYPFWAAVGSQVGRLLALQGEAAARQIQQRIQERYGERSTVSRAVQRVLRSFVDWGVLQDTSRKGIYVKGTTQTIDEIQAIAWLTEALLHAQGTDAASMQTLLGATALFPFQLRPVGADDLAKASETLEVFYHSLDQRLIVLTT